MWKNVVEDWRTEPEAPADRLEAKQPSIDNGLDVLDPKRYYDPEFMQQEWDHIWTKTWQLAVRETDLPDAGSYQTYEFGKESFLFVRGADGNIRGFFNNCRHRGNRLCQAEFGDA